MPNRCKAFFGFISTMTETFVYNKLSRNISLVTEKWLATNHIVQDFGLIRCVHNIFSLVCMHNKILLYSKPVSAGHYSGRIRKRLIQFGRL